MISLWQAFIGRMPCRIPLSRRTMSDPVVWLNNKNEMYSVRSGYHVARKMLREENWVESSRGPVGQQE